MEHKKQKKCPNLNLINLLKIPYKSSQPPNLNLIKIKGYYNNKIYKINKKKYSIDNFNYRIKWNIKENEVVNMKNMAVLWIIKGVYNDRKKSKMRWSLKINKNNKKNLDNNKKSFNNNKSFKKRQQFNLLIGN